MTYDPSDHYEVHLISFENMKHGSAYSVICRDYANLQEWHVKVFERMLGEMKAELAKPVEERRYSKRLVREAREKERMDKNDELTLDDLLDI